MTMTVTDIDLGFYLGNIIVETIRTILKSHNIISYYNFLCVINHKIRLQLMRDLHLLVGKPRSLCLIIV